MAEFTAWKPLLVIVLALLALTVTLTTNILLVMHGHAREKLDGQILRLDQDISSLRLHLTESLWHENFGRCLEAISAISYSVSQPETTETVKKWAARRYAQALLTVTQHGDDLDQPAPSVPDLFDQVTSSRTMNLSPLVDPIEPARLLLIDVHNARLEELQQLKQRSEAWRARDARLTFLGGSLLLLTVILTAFKDLL